MSDDTDNGYMYVVIRNDLSNAQKAVQGSHAAIESGRKFLQKGDKHPFVIFILVKNKQRLERLSESLGFEHVMFREPDIGDEATAIATRPLYGSERKKFSRYQLMA